MGRITIFTIDTCSHCQRIKFELEQRCIPFIEISLTKYPHRRADMVSLCDCLTVPQIFLNQQHIGGADDTLKVLQQWDGQTIATTTATATATATTAATTTTTFDIFQKEVGSQPDPSDERLRQVTASEKEKDKETVQSLLYPDDSSNNNSIIIPLPNGTKASILEIIELLKKNVPHQDLSWNLKLYRNCCTGATMIQGICKAFPFLQQQQEEDALQFGLQLQHEYQIIHHVMDDNNNNSNNKEQKHDLDNTNNNYYRLQCYHTPHILNSYRIWNIPNTTTTNTTHNPKTIMTMILRLTKMMETIITSVSNNNNNSNNDNNNINNNNNVLINYKAAKEHELFIPLEEAICELQIIDLGNIILDRNNNNNKKKKNTLVVAFIINVYNLLIQFAFIKIGIPTGTMNRTTFFTQIKINIGNLLYSFNDLEHGILRGNRTPPYSWSKPFGSNNSSGGGGGGGGDNDPRYKYALQSKEVDNRIHFALNCGAKSCPPIKTFTAEDIDEELRIVSQAFCEDDSNVRVDVNNNTLYLSKLFNWYMIDFANNKNELPMTVVEFLRGTKKEQLQSLLQQQNNDCNNTISIKFMDYDWGVNACNYEVFDANSLQAISFFKWW